MKNVLFLLLIFASFFAQAQQVPIGTWQTHYCYLTAKAIEKVNDKIITGSNQLVSYSLTDKEYTTYSKINGMSDVNVKILRYDASTNYTIIVYENSNIDLMQGEVFFNIPDIKNINATGSKRINSVYFKNELMYLATDLGIIVLNPIKKEIKETYVLQNGANVLSIKDITTFQNNFYVATSNGIYKADENNTALQNFANWTLVNPIPAQYIFSTTDSIFVTTKTELYSLNQSNLNLHFTSTAEIINVRKGSKHFYLVENNGSQTNIAYFDFTGSYIEMAKYINPFDVVEVNDNEIWEADGWYGMVQYFKDAKDKQFFQPNGIYSNSIYNIRIANNKVYVCGGAEQNWTFIFSSAGISQLNKNGNWSYYNRFVGTPAFDSTTDFVDIAFNKKNNNLYVASFKDGLLEIHADNTVSVFKGTPYMDDFGGTYRVHSLAIDKQQNVWMSMYGSNAPLVVKKNDGTWQKIKIPTSKASQLIIDDANQKWMVSPNNGLWVFNDNETIDNTVDDKLKHIQKGEGNGNLPTNNTNCIVKDKDGKIWIGTDEGIAIINCPESIFSTGGCEAELKVVKYDLDAGLLFQNENVKTIAVDGANQKWIGTYNGVWLISNDAEKILYRFTTDNSPLPSNEITKIEVDGETGIVYIGTNNGLISYKGNATDGNTNNNNLLIFPNPVEKNYTGTIAIKGLVENADVRITDANGQLVYRTKAQGGQAIWNGKNYLNQRPRTGVYFVFVTNADGSQTHTGKFIFNE